MWDEWWGLRYNSSQEPKYLHIVKQIIKKEGVAGGGVAGGGDGRGRRGPDMSLGCTWSNLGELGLDFVYCGAIDCDI